MPYITLGDRAGWSWADVAKGQRLDQIVMDLGLFPSRESARTAIIDGSVLVNGEKITKPGVSVSQTAKVELVPNFSQPKFASRGGLKLEKALDEFNVSAQGRICLDIGASTGGFTDCLLQRGAVKVFAIDVGYGQLDWALRTDERVVVKERLNARHLKFSDLYLEDQPRQTLASLVVMDVSFISISRILPVLADVTCDDANFDLVSLIKPQFEAGKSLVGKGGVVRDPETHISVIRNILSVTEPLNYILTALTYSPVKGPAGNIEFLAHWKKDIEEPAVIDVEAIVHEAHRAL